MKTDLGCLDLSKGGELALVLASYTNFFKAVVAISPSTIVWNGISNDGSNPNLSSWTWKGKDFPYLMFDLSKLNKNPPYSYLLGYESVLLQESFNPRAIIPIERAKAAFL